MSISPSPDPEALERADLLNRLGMSVDDPNLSISDLRAEASRQSLIDGERAGNTITTSRPSAVTVGAGTQLYDTTISKPIWSDGAVWRDATGAAV